MEPRQYFMKENQFGAENVKLRKKPNGLPTQDVSRASKVTSMIELFGGDKSVEVASIKAKPYVRNSTVFVERPTQEAIKQRGYVDDVITSKPFSKTSAGTVSVGVRVPKPFMRGTATNGNAVEQNFERKTKFEELKSNKINGQEQKTSMSKSTTARNHINFSNKGAFTEENSIEQSEGLFKPIIETSKLDDKAQQQQEASKSNTTTSPTIKTKSPNSKLDIKPTATVYTSNQNGTSGTSENLGRNSPVILITNQKERPKSPTVVMDVKDGKRISNARNYWEHKLEPRRNLTTRSLTPYKSDSSLNSTKSYFAPPSPSSPKLRIDAPKEFHDRTESISDFRTSPPRTKVVKDNWITPNKFKSNSGDTSSSKTTPPGISPPSPSLKPINAPVKSTVNTSIENDNKKPVVPSRPRFMTTASRFQSTPKPFVSNRLSGVPKVPSSLYSTPTKPRGSDLEKRIATPLTSKTPPLSPRLVKDTNTRTDVNLGNVGSKTALFGGKSTNKHNDANNNTAINPLPKPERTFTFAAADPVQRPPKPVHRNIIRVSSDLTTIKGPGITGNLATVFLNSDLHKSTPDVSTKTHAEGYEEVTLFKPQVGQHQTMKPNNAKKWQKQHNYEEVDDAHHHHTGKPGNYDRIDLQKPPRPLSLSDLDSNYSHLTFQQDLHRAQQSKPSVLVNSAPFQHMKLSKQNSDMSNEMSRSNSISKSERSIESGMKLQITDKIRDAFSQINRRYRHHRKNNEDGGSDGDAKSLSSSGDEDSDTEMDLSRHRQTLDRTRTMQKTYRSTLKYKSLERELSGLDKSTVFEQVLICKIVADKSNKISSKVSYRFPAPPPGKNIGDEKTLAHFCFADIDGMEPCEEMMSHSYSFMLTREDGTRKFGYCRRILPPGDGPRYPVVYCLISALGSFGLYETVLDELERRHRVSLKKVSIFLESLFIERFPAPGRSVRVEIDEPDGTSYFVLRRPFDTRLEHVDLQCLLSELGVDNTIKIFSSLLLERRVIISGKSLSILTACIHAFRALLYPFVWQHVFVPVLPPPMVDLCCSPTPLLIGILETSLEKLRTLPLEEVFLVNLSTKEVLSSAGDEMEILPRKLQTPLINSLNNFTNNMQGMEPNYDFATDYESAERNTVISESFMHLFVEMIGHYQNHFQTDVQSNTPAQNRWGKILRTFNRISFYEDVTSRSLRRFLDLFMGTQVFDGFIHSRELANSDYEGLFERRIARHLLTADVSNLNFKVFRTKMKRFMQGIGKKKI